MVRSLFNFAWPGLERSAPGRPACSDRLRPPSFRPQSWFFRLTDLRFVVCSNQRIVQTPRCGPGLTCTSLDWDPAISASPVGGRTADWWWWWWWWWWQGDFWALLIVAGFGRYLILIFAGPGGSEYPDAYRGVLGAAAPPQGRVWGREPLRVRENLAGSGGGSPPWEGELATDFPH